MPLPITFLSDYGYDDEFAGVCRAVIARLAPGATLIDLTHGIPRHDVRAGAAVLENALPYAPPGVHLAVVDPGVGSARKAVAVAAAAEGRLLVGPDNGLLWPALERFGGAMAAVDLTLSPQRLEPLSATFHGRDIFAPVAAALASGTPLAAVGEAIEPDSLARLEPTRPAFEDGRVVAHVAYADRFGNLALDLVHDDIPRTGLRVGRRLAVEAAGREHEALFALTFADVGQGELVLYEDSYRHLALAVNRGSAADLLRAGPGDAIGLRALA